MFESIGTGELLLILLVIVIFFGPKKIPDIARGLGKSISEFKKAMRDVETELTKPVVTPEPPQLKAPVPEMQNASDKTGDASHSEQKILDNTHTRTQH
jgi:sec-independent protein translocase protein TatA